MKVILNNNREFLVVWHHRLPQQQNSAKMSALLPAKTEEGTSCYIYELMGGNRDLVCSVELKRYYKDTYSKEVGRKYSLERALKQCGFQKEERRQFWDAYLDRKPKIITVKKHFLDDVMDLFSRLGDSALKSRSDSPELGDQSISAKQ